MYIYNKDGRKEHILIDSGRVITAAKVAIAVSHMTGTALADYATVTIKGIPKSTNTAYVAILPNGKLNLPDYEDGVTDETVTDDAVVTVFDLPYSSNDYIGITIEVIDDVNKTLKSINECHITWISAPVLTPGTNNTGV